MNYPFEFPYTTKNLFGESLTFHSIVEENGEKKMIVLNTVSPGAGPPFHVHYKQDESLAVTKGLLGYQIDGEEEKFLKEGESVVFTRGQMHRFWNAGEDVLECEGWVKPANTFDYFITGIYNSMNKAGKAEGDPFDSAFLMTRYKTEYDLKDIPTFVKKVVFPVTVVIGRFLGKYKDFRDAPKAIK
jgi:quercetin dioxygenase-like cupin family protein